MSENCNFMQSVDLTVKRLLHTRVWLSWSVNASDSDVVSLVLGSSCVALFLEDHFSMVLCIRARGVRVRSDFVVLMSMLLWFVNSFAPPLLFLFFFFRLASFFIN